MALTKVQKTGITDNAIDADKIEDGTIVAADIAPGTITNDKLAGSIANDKLANSSITVNGTSVSLGGSVTAGKVQWQSVVTADGSTATSATAGYGYFIDTTSAAHTLTLPGSPSAGDTIAIKDYAGTFGTNALTIARNGNNIQGVANNSEISTNRASVVLVYIDATKGWLYTNESNVADLGEPQFISATGGTITTSGDYKIHTFTGDGCFVVAIAGSGTSSEPSVVDYLVIAGGAGAGAEYSGGGGGAGGYRESKASASPTHTASPHTASPLAASSGITITATTYPITVGGGGAGKVAGIPGVPSTNGSSSLFSTITSAGGGGGGRTAQSGGSGGGGGEYELAGSGNTPPVSPPQGNNGGRGNPGGTYGGGGGGGAGAAGSVGTPGNGGNGGAGTTSSINGTPTARAGGGGGGGEGGSQGTGGTGGGGPAGAPVGTPGTANTGGGAGGGGGPAGNESGGNGGKGIVIIRYKYQ